MDCNPYPRATTEAFACSGCPIGDCPAAQGHGEPALSGRRLVVASLVLFVVPAVLAIAGAAWFRASEGAQLGGALAGLGIGMAAAVAAAKRLGRADSADPTKTSR